MALTAADELEIDRLVALEFAARAADDAARAAGALGSEPAAWPFRMRARQDLLLTLARRRPGPSSPRPARRLSALLPAPSPAPASESVAPADRPRGTARAAAR